MRGADGSMRIEAQMERKVRCRHSWARRVLRRREYPAKMSTSSRSACWTPGTQRTGEQRRMGERRPTERLGRCGACRVG